MIRFRKLLFAACAGLAILFVGDSTAHASFTIDYDIPNTAAGSISYAGNSGSALAGSNIAIDSIFAPGSGATPLSVTGGQLNFSTGPATGTSDGITTFSTAGSSISITGSTSVASGTLLSGVLTGTAEVINLGGGVFEIVETAVFTPSSPAVAAYFNDPTGVPYVGTLAITFDAGTTGSGTTGNGFSEGSSNGFISSGNVGVVPTPAPSGLLLAGCGGAFCLLGYGLRRRSLASVAAA